LNPLKPTHEKRIYPIKPTIALVFAGGTTTEYSPGNIPKYKALLPVYGQPIANHVIRALEQSNVERIFILQDEGARLEEILITGAKCVFYEKNQHQNSLGLSMLSGVEKVAEYYGGDELFKKSIMFVPCDIPLATKDQFNVLMEKAACKNADVILTIIADELIKKRFPQRRFRSGYLADLKGRYTAQMIGFLNGDLIQYEPSAEPGRMKISFRGVGGERLNRLRKTLDSIREHRNHDYSLPHFTEKLALFWIMKGGFMFLVIRAIVGMIFRRLTIAKIMEYFHRAGRVNFDYIISEEAEISGDIDQPEDFPIVLGIPWEMENKSPEVYFSR
jgi:molybdopterin-guanine dinucleotide biosynthesis protein A